MVERGSAGAVFWGCVCAEREMEEHRSPYPCRLRGLKCGLVVDEAEGRLFRRVPEVGAQARTSCAIINVGLMRVRGSEEIIQLRRRANVLPAAHAAGAVGARSYENLTRWL